MINDIVGMHFIGSDFQINSGAESTVRDSHPLFVCYVPQQLAAVEPIHSIAFQGQKLSRTGYMNLKLTLRFYVRVSFS